ncbi:uncharacterized protein LOC131615131 [Vicia villosa]|uniref:uncharacterized protein LOC131615131 n=1 Tax=Vicia villosa TaxID=3911 RepID=UPI00273BB493|nr:uncharacterized protein LOC131615131 [Vicia villosa]
MLETQISQVAQTTSAQVVPGGQFSGQTQPNPKGTANSTTLRSGTAYEGPRNPNLSTSEKPKEDAEPKDQRLDDPKPLECHSISENKLAKKDKDPGSFSIPCVLGYHTIDKAFFDLGASVSLMPLAVCKRLKLGKLQPTKILSQLANRSVKYPMGILEDIPVKIGQLYIPTDFVVMDIKEDDDIPILLGRPFLSTAGAIIDVKKGKLTF